MFKPHSSGQNGGYRPNNRPHNGQTFHRRPKKPEAEVKDFDQTGIIKVTAKGKGLFFTGTTIGKPIDRAQLPLIIEAEGLHNALNNDLVVVNGREVKKVIERTKLIYVGAVSQNEAGQLIMTADDQRLYKPLLLPPDTSSDLVGQKIAAQIDQFEPNDDFPTGKVLEVLGKQGQHETEIKAILAERQLAVGFSKEVMAEADKLEQTWRADIQAEATNRLDYRGITTFTIDPADAKDFDDALSVQTLPNGHFEIGVHIADVSFYVRPGTDIDAEARRRATSIYLVDRTISMLPEVLSNQACSLNPNEDRLAFSAIFELDTTGKILNSRFARTIIHSDYRFTYESAQEVLDAKSGPYFAELNTINTLAKILREENKKAGAISFEDSEIKFVLDEEKRPIGVIKKVRGDTHLMIEDFMLLANKKVAEFGSHHNKNQDFKFIYRIHDNPNPERLESLNQFLKPLGYELPIENGEVSGQAINEMLKLAESRAESNIINRATVRAMAKAIYSMVNVGHFGLAFENYTHFTSPIRRYPDLIVHRLLNMYLNNENPSHAFLEDVGKMALHASEMEQKAAEAERESIKMKQVEFMSGKIGQTFDAVISGVTDYGFFIEDTETKAEGLVRVATIGDDFYSYDEKTISLVGEATKKRFRLGDNVKVKLMAADILHKTLDFELVK